MDLQEIEEAKEKLVSDMKLLLARRTLEALGQNAFQDVKMPLLEYVDLTDAKGVLLDWELPADLQSSETSYKKRHVVLRPDGKIYLLTVSGGPTYEDGGWVFFASLKDEISNEDYFQIAPSAIKEVQGLIAEAKKKQASAQA